MVIDMIERQGKKTLASELKHRIVIQELTMDSDGEGGFTETWNNVDTIYAAIYPISAKQKFEYQTVGIDATHVIKIRGNVNINTTI